MQKVTRKLREEPLIPLGAALTVVAFVNAYRAIRRGDSKQANRMFRARVGAQAFTVIAMVAGSMYYSKDREKSAELRKLQEARDAEEKRQKWIRELEARDDEDKAFRAAVQQRVKDAGAGGQLQQQAGAAEDGGEVKTEGTGGILGKMGLWPQGEKKAAEEEKLVAETEDEKRSKNPKSSLGDIGAIMASQKKKGDEPKK